MYAGRVCIGRIVALYRGAKSLSSGRHALYQQQLLWFFDGPVAQVALWVLFTNAVVNIALHPLPR